MNFALLSRILKDNNIPENVKMFSDSGWECEPTDMDGIFYSEKLNAIVFTQSGRSARQQLRENPKWKLIYGSDLEAYMKDDEMSDENWWGMCRESRKWYDREGNYLADSWEEIFYG